MNTQDEQNEAPNVGADPFAGMPLIRPQKDNPRHQAFVRLVIAGRDWGAALASIRYLIANVKGRENALLYPLTAASVVCYARPFLGGRSHAQISGNYRKIEDPHLKDLHKTVMDFRHEVVAHSNEDRYHVALLPKGTTFETADGKIKGTLATHGEYVRGPEIALEAFPGFEALVDYQLDRLKTEIDSEKGILFPDVPIQPDTPAPSTQ